MSTAIAKTWTERYAQLSHGKTRYWEAGSGYPTLLIHGAGWNSGCESWAATIGPLSAHLRVLAIDCLNWGLGDVFDQEFSFAYLVDHVREFMDVLGLDRVNLVGHSMGGWIGTLLAYESPNRLNRFVNVAGGGTATRPLQTMLNFKAPAPDVIRQQYSRVPLPADEQAQLAQTFITKLDLPGHQEAFGKVMKHMTEPMTRSRYNTLRRLPFITVPTLVVWGRDDQVNGLDECGTPTANGIPGAKFIVYDNTGHSVPWEQPEQFPRDVLNFLQ